MPGYDGYEISHNKDGSITFLCSPAEPGTYKFSVEHNGMPLVGLPMCCVVQKTEDGYVTAYKTGDEFEDELAAVDNPQPEEIAEGCLEKVGDLVAATEALGEEPTAIYTEFQETQGAIQPYEMDPEDSGSAHEPGHDELWPDPESADDTVGLPKAIIAEAINVEAQENLDGFEVLPMEIQTIKQEPDLEVLTMTTRRKSGRNIAVPIKFEDFITPTKSNHASRSPVKSITNEIFSTTLPEERLAKVVIKPPPEYKDEPKQVFHCTHEGCAMEFDKLARLKRHEHTHEERLIICDVLDCKKQFKVITSMIEHRKTVHSIEEKQSQYRDYPCSVRGCDKRLNSVRALRKHLDDDHESIKDTICPHCPRVMKTPAKVLEHLQTHAEELNFECNYEECDMKFRTKRMLEAHLKNHTGKALCPDCGKTFASRGNLNKHVENMHKNPKERKLTLSGIKTPDLTHNEENTMMCDSCGRTFKNRSSLKNHLREMHIMEEMKVIDDNNRLLPYRPFKCKHCGKGFKRIAVMRAHVALHESTTTVPCPKESCPKMFPTIFKMKDHVRTVHKNEDQRHACEYPGCGKEFKKAAALNVHVRKHRNERFPCIAPDCSQTFSTKFCAQSHFQVVHEQIEPKHFCKMCGRGYRLKLHLTRHMLTHVDTKDYVCTTCGKCFKTKTTLLSHSRIHSLDKQYSCDFCEKSFPRKYRLMQHINATHTAVLPAGMSVDVQNTIAQIQHGSGKHILVIEEVDLPQDMEL